MKICYLNQTLKGGSGAANFYNSLSAAMKKLAPGLNTESLASENLLYPNKLKLLLALPVIRSVFKRCDLIHALDGWPYGVVAALANIGLAKPLIITAVGTGAVKPLYNPLKRRLLGWAYRRADRVVAVSNNTKREILKFLPDLKVEVIPHGVDAARFQSVHAGYQEEARKLGPYILSVGSLKPRKGFQYSIEAFAKIAASFPDLKYVIVGGGPERENLEYRIKNLGIENRVVFLSHIHQDYVSALYQNARLFMLLSQDDQKDIEGFGLVFLEAAACGLPIIATRGTSAEDAVLDGQNGILVPPRDPGAAAEAMHEILSDSNTRKKMFEESLKFAGEMNWEKAAESYKKIYSKILDSRF